MISLGSALVDVIQKVASHDTGRERIFLTTGIATATTTAAPTAATAAAIPAAALEIATTTTAIPAAVGRLAEPRLAVLTLLLLALIVVASDPFAETPGAAEIQVDVELGMRIEAVNRDQLHPGRGVDHKISVYAARGQAGCSRLG